MQARLKEMMLQKHKKASQQQVNHESLNFGSRITFNSSETSTPISSFKNSNQQSSARNSVSSFFNSTPQQHSRRGNIDSFESGENMFATKDNPRQPQKRSQLNRNPYFAI